MDKLAPIRQILEMFVENCKKNYIPSEFVTIDEILVVFRGSAPFRQYIPSKPAKYGIKIYPMCDAKTLYVCNTEIYARLQPEGLCMTKSTTHQMPWSQDLYLTSLALLEMSHLITGIPATH